VLESLAHTSVLECEDFIMLMTSPRQRPFVSLVLSSHRAFTDQMHTLSELFHNPN